MNQRTKRSLPFDPGEAVGYQQQRCTVVYVPVNGWDRIKVQLPDGSTAWAGRGELSDPPPLAEHVEQAALEFAGMLRNPQAVLGGGE